MSKRYAIWNKTDTVYTPSGANFTAEQWMDRYSWIKISSAVPVMSAGLFNGSMIDELGRMKTRCEAAGATFDADLSGQDLLDAIEAWEDEQAAKAAEEAAELANQPTTEERIAAAMEFQNMLSL